jgi:anti-anti-sigma factor
MGLRIALEQKGDKHILRLQGKINVQTSLSLHEQIEELFQAKHKKILLDFSQVDELNLEGVRMIQNWTKKWQAMKGNLGLCNLKTDLIQLIESTGNQIHLLIYRDEQEALKAMA